MNPVWQNPIQITVRTAHLSVLITVHNCRTQHSTEQFWLSSLLTSITAQILSIGGDGAQSGKSYLIYILLQQSPTDVHIHEDSFALAGPYI